MVQFKDLWKYLFVAEYDPSCDLKKPITWWQSESLKKQFFFIYRISAHVLAKSWLMIKLNCSYIKKLICIEVFCCHAHRVHVRLSQPKRTISDHSVIWQILNGVFRAWASTSATEVQVFPWNSSSLTQPNDFSLIVYRSLSWIRSGLNSIRRRSP